MSSEFLSKDIIYIDSSERLSGTSTNFTIDISDQLRVPNEYDRATLLSFACPKSYYLIDSHNDSFGVFESKITIITLPHGNYSFSSLASLLNTMLEACEFSYVCSADVVSGKYRFDVSGNGGVQPIFNFQGESPAGIMGFNYEGYYFTNNTLVSPNIVNFQKARNIKLSCNLVKRGILSTIIPNTQDYSYIAYVERNPAFTSQQLISNNVTSVNFSLLDGGDNSVLDLNGLDITFTFVMYKKNDFYEKIISDKKKEVHLSILDDQLHQLEARLKELDNKK